MNKILSLVILAVMVALGANAAWADGPFPTAMTDGTLGPIGSVTPSDTLGPNVYNNINLLLGTSYTNNAQVDSLEYTGNASTWAATGGSASGAVIGLSAFNSNTFEAYNTNTPGTLISPLGTSFTGSGFTGSGTSTSPFAGVTTAALPAGATFGFAINTVGISTLNGSTLTPAGGTDWYSNKNLNSDGMDHMLVYNLSALTGTQIYIKNPTTGVTSTITLEDPYLLEFEDLPLTANGAPSDLDYNDLAVLVNGVAPVPEPITVALFGVGLLAMAGFALRRKLSFLGNLAFAG